ncbi:MAG TPA: cytochrome b N-terminal domain-containing protein [Gaiellaceae bacterium]|nr:cytochrome b N-terminal domain-containing protein [Gaiellaceae bacterium]
MIRAAVRALDRGTGSASRVKKALRYLFPDHWSFMLGEVALYAFLVLVATGIYLVFFFQDSTAVTTYHGPYTPLDGASMTKAYKSVLDISFSVRAGLLIRQTHHWAADVFVVAIVLHLFRIFFTGAFRTPRRLTYYLGLTMLVLSLLEGYAGYSLADDLLSGMGLAIGYSVLLSVPLVGANLAALVWGSPFPGAPDFWSRLYIVHVLILPVAIGTLLLGHLTLVAARHHTQFRESARTTERRIVGIPAFPSQAPRSLALMFGVCGVLFLLGGLVQINPVWLWGPYHVGASTNGAQPDWYLGWLIGALRLVPGFDVVVDNRTLIPNPFWGGVLFPGLVFGLLFAWPWLERRFARDREPHNLLQRPRDNPWRTSIGAAVVTWVFLIFMAGSADRVQVLFGLGYAGQIEVYRVLIWVAPVVVLFAARRVCRELRDGERVAQIRSEAAEAKPLQAAGGNDPRASSGV